MYLITDRQGKCLLKPTNLPGHFSMYCRFARAGLRTEQADQLPHVDEEGEQVVAHEDQALLDAPPQPLPLHDLGGVEHAEVSAGDPHPGSELPAREGQRYEQHEPGVLEQQQRAVDHRQQQPRPRHFVES